MPKDLNNFNQTTATQQQPITEAPTPVIPGETSVSSGKYID